MTMPRVAQEVVQPFSRMALVRIVGGLDLDGTTAYPISVASDGSILNRNMVYDYNVLAWVPMVQPTGGTGGTPAPTPTNRVLTEAGDVLTTEDGNTVVQE